MRTGFILIGLLQLGGGGSLQAQQSVAPLIGWESSATTADGPRVPSRELVSVPDSVRKPTGGQHWRGAAIGAAIGGALGVVIGAARGKDYCLDCTRQPSARGRVLRSGLIGAGAGGGLGFLVGLTTLKYTWVPSETH